MGIILLILKIIGITLLSILGLIILVLLLILFVPIRYNITVGNQQGEGKLYARARATWLLHLINCLVSYYEELYYRVRITFIKLVSSDKKEKKSSKANRKHNKKENGNKAEKSERNDLNTNEKSADNSVTAYTTHDKSSDDKGNINVNKAENTDDTAKITDNIDNDDNTNNNDENDEIGESTYILDDGEPEENQSFFDKAKEVIEKIIDVILNIPDKITAVINKVNDIRDNIDYYINAINDERNKEAFSKCLTELLKILKNIRPRKLTGNLLIGRENPYSYGQMSSILGIAYPFINDKIKIETRSDEDITSYYIYTKGRVTVFVLLVAFIKIYFNRDIKRMIKIFKHEGR